MRFLLLFYVVFCEAAFKDPCLSTNFTCEPGDQCLCVGGSKDPNSLGGSGPGSVWLRQEGDVKTFYYIPDEGDFEGQCRRATFDTVVCYTPPWDKGALHSMVECTLDAKLCACKYPSTPHCDVASACTELVKIALLDQSQEESFWDGVLHPRFGSWARYDAICLEDVSSDKVVCSEVSWTLGYNVGSVWVQVSSQKAVLCYRPEGEALGAFRPEGQTLGSLCYRCDLEKSFSQCPANWADAFDHIVCFAYDVSPKTLAELFPAKADYLTLMSKAFLSGRGARFDEAVWFVWKPLIDDYVAVAAGDKLLQGCVVDGFYGRDAVWLRGDKGQRALRYRSEDDVVFQYAPAAKYKPALCDKLLCTEEALDYEWKKVVRDFILGG